MSGQDPLALTEWQRIRRYAVPARMIAECTAARERGDWRAACAAGEIDVLIDDPAPVAEQLAGFAPDLLRWHILRALGGHTTIAPGLAYVLVPHGVTFGPDSVVLVVDSPVSLFGSQRLTLRTARWDEVDPADLLPLAPYRWDARHAADLRAASSASPERLPGFRPDGTPLPDAELGTGDDRPAHAERVRGQKSLAEAFIEAGFEITDDGVEHWQRHADQHPRLDPLRIAHDLPVFTAALGQTTWPIWIAYNLALRIDVDGATPRVGWISIDYRTRHAPDPRQADLNPGLIQYGVDLDLIRNGRLAVGDLHPLVRAALFPGVAASLVSPFRPDDPVRVRCRGEWHSIEVRHGRLTLSGHSEAEQQRERAMRAFGGAVTGCFAAEQTWTGTAGRLPKRLRAHREDLWQRMLHGGTRAVLELLDAGMDPNLRDGRGRTLMHRLRSYDHRVLMPRLLAAGVDVNSRDLEGSTPLFLAVVYQAPADLILALADAGADPHAPNQYDMSVFDYIDDVLEYRDELPADFEAAVARLQR